MANIFINTFRYGFQSPQKVDEIQEELKTRLSSQGHVVNEPSPPHPEDSLPGYSPEKDIRQRKAMDAERRVMRSADCIISIFPENASRDTFEDSTIKRAMELGEKENKLWIPILLAPWNATDKVLDSSPVEADTISPSEVADEVGKRIYQFLAERKKALKKLEKNIASYVTTAITDLQKREKIDRWTAGACYLFGFVALMAGAYLAYQGLLAAIDIKEGEWIKFALLGLKSIIILALVFACSRYLFTLGNSVMNEALRSANRIHAIRFGEFYLNAYGDKAEWEQIKEVFQNWNIDRTSPFASMNADSYDPKLLDKAMDLVKTAIEKGSDKGK